MRNYSQRIERVLICIALLALLLALPGPALSAVNVESLQPQGYLSDFAGVVDASSKASIEQYCYRVEQSLGVQIALVTVNSLEGEDIADFSLRLARHFGVGAKKGDQGVMLLLAVKDRKSRVEVGRGIEPYVTDGFSGSTLRSIRAPLQSGNYGQALYTAAQVMGQQIAQGKGLSIEGEQPTRPIGRQRGSSIPWPLILIGLFFFVWLLSRGGRGGRGGPGGQGVQGGRGGMDGLLPGIILGNILGGGRGGWSGGGWGDGGGFGGSGGGGHGGFGGFGGGGFGGGGASSDW